MQGSLLILLRLKPFSMILFWTDDAYLLRVFPSLFWSVFFFGGEFFLASALGRFLLPSLFVPIFRIKFFGHNNDSEFASGFSGILLPGRWANGIASHRWKPCLHFARPPPKNARNSPSNLLREDPIFQIGLPIPSALREILEKFSYSY